MFFIDMISNDGLQDRVAVNALLMQALREIEEKFGVRVKKVRVRADGAGYYRSVFTRLAAFTLHQ